MSGRDQPRCLNQCAQSVDTVSTVGKWPPFIQLVGKLEDAKSLPQIARMWCPVDQSLRLEAYHRRPTGSTTLRDVCNSEHTHTLYYTYVTPQCRVNEIMKKDAANQVNSVVVIVVSGEGTPSQARPGHYSQPDVRFVGARLSRAHTKCNRRALYIFEWFQ